MNEVALRSLARQYLATLTKEVFRIHVDRETWNDGIAIILGTTDGLSMVATIRDLTMTRGPRAINEELVRELRACVDMLARRRAGVFTVGDLVRPRRRRARAAKEVVQVNLDTKRLRLRNVKREYAFSEVEFVS